jgi:hypothetical protein
MFGATFLGHQGWLFSAGDTHIAVDPLLTDDFCETGHVGRVFPPRRFDLERFPPISAVFFSHEHNDHFAIPTLHRLDRRILILLSARSSHAARSILREMGFEVKLVAPGDAISVGSLSIHAFSAEHRTIDNYDEWDVLPYLIADRDGHGSFFSHVDAEPTERVERAARAIVERPGIWCYTNNAGRWSFVTAGGRAAPVDSLRMVTIALNHYAALQSRWGSPAALLWSGGGMSFEGDRAWLNRNVFTADSNRVCAALSALVPDALHLAPTPGQTVWMESGRVASVQEETAFLRTAPRSEWPSREFIGDVQRMDQYRPASGRSDFDESDLHELMSELAGFGGYLYGTRTFRNLMSWNPDGSVGRRPTFALVLRADGAKGAYLFEYDPQACTFSESKSQNPVKDYLGGIELWATDFLAMCRGELGPIAIPFGRGRVWTASPDHFVPSFRDLCLYFHPLRRPEQFLRLYRSQVEAEERRAPQLRGKLRSA